MLAMLGIHGLGPIRMFHLTEHIAGPRAAVGILLIIILVNYTKTQNELKVRLFDEVKELLSDFTKTDEYLDYLCSKIREAARFADGEEMTIYISPSDKEKQTELEKRTGMTITISEYDFMGGMRAVIRGRNILIDHSFQAAVDYEYHQFSFAAGGAGIE